MGFQAIGLLRPELKSVIRLSVAMVWRCSDRRDGPQPAADEWRGPRAGAFDGRKRGGPFRCRARQEPRSGCWAEADINQRALALNRINTELASADNRRACYSDLLKDAAGDFAFMLANPPYLVDPGERAYRHGGGRLGAGLSLAILDTALTRLVPGSTPLLYTGVARVDGRDPFLEEVRSRLADRDVASRYRELNPEVFGEKL